MGKEKKSGHTWVEGCQRIGQGFFPPQKFGMASMYVLEGDYLRQKRRGVGVGGKVVFIKITQNDDVEKTIGLGRRRRANEEIKLFLSLGGAN